MNLSSNDWRDEDVEKLRHAVLIDKLSAGEIVEVLKWRFSRNAIIGKVHRLAKAGEAIALSGGSYPSTGPRRPRRPKAEHPAAPPAGAASAPSGEPAADLPPAPVALASGPPPGPPRGKNGVRLLDRLPFMCKWPIGDPGKPDFRFCGHTRLNWREWSADDTGPPYCEEHTRLASGGRAKAA